MKMGLIIAHLIDLLSWDDLALLIFAVVASDGALPGRVGVGKLTIGIKKIYKHKLN
jgi:hypothetical protein